ncbi:MAG: CDP-diacylglycerol--glycerol-3-phosphate 3-phosphatidyltransferase [Pseudomonadota bacterium]
MTATVPNLLTLARVMAAPLVALLYLSLDRITAGWAAFIIFSAASATDYLDGYLARKWDQVSGFGRMMDPVADKAMVVIAGALLMALYELSWVVVAPMAAILLREVLVSGLREYLKGANILSVTRLAKYKTTCQLFAIGALILAEPLGASYPGLGVVAEWIGLASLWLAAALTIITGWDYLTKGMAVIREEDGT